MEHSGRKDAEELTLPQGPRSIVVGKSEIVILPNIGRVPRKSIRSAYVDNRFGDSRVILQLGWWRRSIWIRVDSAEQGEEVVAALGFGTLHHRVQFSGATPFRGRAGVLVVGCVLAVVLAILGWMRLEASLISLLAFYLVLVVVLDAMRPKLTVDLNGVTLHRVLKRERLSFGDVSSVEGRRQRFGGDVVLNRKRGPALTFNVDTDLPGRTPYGQVLQHVQQALAAYAERHPPSAIDALLERGGRSNEEWLRDLRALRSGSRYRVAAVDEGELRKIVSDGAQPEHLRVAAEIALATDDDEEANVKRLAELAALDREDA